MAAASSASLGLPFHTASIILLLIISPCACFGIDRKVTSSCNWAPAGATWYGDADGAGSSGGACGYGDAVARAPFSSMISAGNPKLYKSGEGCGACYQVMCTNNSACSGNPVKVVITDECLGGGACTAERIHFDMSGMAFGAMAKPGHADQLRSAGVIHVQYARVACRYSGLHVQFVVDAGSNAYYLAVRVMYIGGRRNLVAVAVRQGVAAAPWMPMRRSWGAVWVLDSSAALQPPFSFQLKCGITGSILVANNVVPIGWKAGATYTSHVNYGT